MVRLRSEFDGDRETANGFERFKSIANSYEIRCGMCGRTGFVDEVTFQNFRAAVDAGLDSPFSCELCQEEYDDLAYEG